MPLSGFAGSHSTSRTGAFAAGVRRSPPSVQYWARPGLAKAKRTRIATSAPTTAIARSSLLRRFMMASLQRDGFEVRLLHTGALARVEHRGDVRVRGRAVAADADLLVRIRGRG